MPCQQPSGAPPCDASDRLRLWKPLHTDSSLSPSAFDHICDVIVHAWAASTRATYGAGLAAFHIFCDLQVPPIPEDLRGPVPEPLLLDFITSLAGLYSGSLLKNHLYGLKAWHTLHGLAWSLDDDRMKAVLKAAERLAPAESCLPPRPPYTPAIIEALYPHFDLSQPLDASVYSCLTTTFWAIGRTGEFTVPSIKAFKQQPSNWVTPANVTSGLVGPLGLPVTEFKVPVTKCAQMCGEVLSWSRQDGFSDPDHAYRNHLLVNTPPPGGHLFAYRDKHGASQALSESVFSRRVKKAFTDAGLEPLQNHGLRIGGVLVYLLRGIPFDVVKSMGRWEGDAFALYLRQHAHILAPYLQSTPILEPFVRIAMPCYVR
ncbi:hypothetical protein BKA70DRAFT_1113599 [Coprinopsis sp. MPI-PUGE-AT-0042]|nr:hypothetical protein BKA70DRAFT_1113599 [Coprinopsis sp. MPI-PUGE-AT-0042]